MGTISLTLHDSLDSLAAMEEASSCSYLGGALECSSFFARGKKIQEPIIYVAVHSYL